MAGCWRLPGKPSDAEPEYRKALTIYRKLVEDDPKVLDYRFEAAQADHLLSVVCRRLGRPAEALDNAERDVAACEVLVKEDPRKPSYGARLAESYLGRGQARLASGDFAGAATDLRRALKLHHEHPPHTNFKCFHSAEYHAALAGLARQAGSGVSADEGATEAETAMTLLRKAVATNYRSVALRIDDSLEPLRGRDDFRLLMMDLAFPAQPFAQTAKGRGLSPPCPTDLKRTALSVTIVRRGHSEYSIQKTINQRWSLSISYPQPIPLNAGG